MQRDRMTDGAAFPIGGNHLDMVLSGKAVVKRPQALRMDAIIICQQNVHLFFAMSNVYYISSIYAIN